MIASLRHYHPLLETYLQSLWPQAKSEAPIDDAYFLSTIDFSRGYREGDRGRRGRQIFIFGGNPVSRQVKVNNGEKWDLNPDGYLDMFFADLESFDADTYSLQYVQSDKFNNTICFLYDVFPKAINRQGQFKGQVWVEIDHLKIIRIRGTFTSGSVPLIRRIVGGTIPIYLNFDSVREQVTPGNWLPSYCHFEANRTWKELNHNGETDFHYRGHSFMWHYEDTESQIHSGTAGLRNLSRLEGEGLLATEGVVEGHLNDIVQQIVSNKKLPLARLNCRVLLTTPLELFTEGHTIVVSRGLLNLVPGSVLPVLLSYGIAEELTAPMSDSPSLGKVLDRRGTMTPVNSDSNASWETALALASVTHDPNVATDTSLFFSQLAYHSKQIPNLMLERFGPPTLRARESIAFPHSIVGMSASALSLRGTYTIDSGTGQVDINPPINQTPVNALMF